MFQCLLDSTFRGFSHFSICRLQQEEFEHCNARTGSSELASMQHVVFTTMVTAMEALSVIISIDRRSGQVIIPDSL